MNKILTTLKRGTLLAVALIIPLLSFTSSAFAEGVAVRYSYAKTEFGGQTIYALIPTADPRLNSESTKINIKKAFEALKSDKSNTYLNTEISISGSNSLPTATVNIDPKAAAKGYALIIMAETVYTLSELGVFSVSFPNYAVRAMSRGDIPFVAFTAVVPLWKALSPTAKRQAISSENIQVIFPDGEIVPSKEVAKLWKSKNSKIDNALYEYLKAPDSYTIKEVAKLLHTWKLPAADKIVALLGNPSVSVQKVGLELLSDDRDNKKVLDSVKAYLGIQIKKNKEQAAMAANWLGKVKDKSYAIEQPLFFIENGTPEQALNAAISLADYNDKASIKVLENKLESKDGAVAIACVDSLAKLNQYDILEKNFKNKKIETNVKIEIAKKLSLSPKESEQLAGLQFLVENGSVKERVDAVKKLGTIPSSGSRALLDGYLTSDDDFVRNTAIEQLLVRADLASLNAVAKAMKSGPDKDSAEKIGDAIMEKLDFLVVEKKTRDKNDEIQRLAYRAISKKSKIRSVLEVLERGIEHKSPTIRGASTIAILEFRGKFADKVDAAIKKSATDSDPNVRRDAAIAIGTLPSDVLVDSLENLLQDKDNQVLASAIEAAAKRQDVNAWKVIKSNTKSKDENVRAAAYLALAKLTEKSDAKGVKEVISLLSGAVSDKSKVVKLAAIEGLGEFKDDRAVASIAVNAANEDIAIRIATIKAAAKSGHPSAKSILTTALDDKDAAVRLASINGILLFKDKTIKTDLAKRLEKEQDPEIRTELEKAQKSL